MGWASAGGQTAAGAGDGWSGIDQENRRADGVRVRARRSRGARLRRALILWGVHSVVICLVGLALWFGFSWSENGAPPEGWAWVLTIVALSPALTVLFGVLPTPYSGLPVVLVWRRMWRSVRLSRPSSRRVWQARYGHVQTVNAWDLWGATALLSSETDEALRRERADRKQARRDRRQRRADGRI